MNRIQLSEIDRRILAELAIDGRTPYKVLADRVGIPASTCHGRVRALEQQGVIRGYRADIDPLAAGHMVSALILITVHSHQRGLVTQVAEAVRHIPGVQQVFLIGGEKDIVVHVSTSSVEELRNLIAEHLATQQALTQTETQIVFEHLSGTRPYSSI